MKMVAISWILFQIDKHIKILILSTKMSNLLKLKYEYIKEK